MLVVLMTKSAPSDSIVNQECTILYDWDGASAQVRAGNNEEGEVAADVLRNFQRLQRICSRVWWAGAGQDVACGWDRTG